MTEQRREYKTKSTKTDQSQSRFVPNSYQTPNAYVDDYLALLTGEEWKALSYAIRRILGFNKRRDRISLSQFANGIRDKNDQPLDFGCGLSINTLRNVLKRLCEFGFLIRTSENDPIKNEGPEYELQLDDSKINLSLLLARDKHKTREAKSRTRKAITVMRAKRNQYPLMSDSSTPPSRATVVPPLMSHDTPPLMSDDNTITRENQGKSDRYIQAEIEEMSVREIRALPEMKLFESITGRFPGQYQWFAIVDFLQNHLIAKDKLSECWNEWAVKKGYRPNDLTWLLDWSINGIHHGKNGNSKKPENHKDDLEQRRQKAKARIKKAKESAI